MQKNVINVNKLMNVIINMFIHYKQTFHVVKNV